MLVHLYCCLNSPKYHWVKIWYAPLLVAKMCHRITLLSALFHCTLLLLLDGNSFMSSLLYAGILPGSNMVCCLV